jgi:2-polyprenyl-6-hydroxyphenyl methylase/3-demethylubiquinone-9 3-methyltransferase
MASLTASSIDPASAALFGREAAAWWDPRGSSKLLHRVNPVRLGYLRQQGGAHWGWPATEIRPAHGLTALDIGCGGGLLTEPLARLGFTATGLDASPEAIAVAQAHAAETGLAITYQAGSVEALATTGHRFDLVTCMEVIEHVADVPAFLAAVAALLEPGGLLLFSTPNRTMLSWSVMIAGAERIARVIPRGAHTWKQFLRPEELTQALAGAGLRVTDIQGITLGRDLGFALGADRSVNYIGSAGHA